MNHQRTNARLRQLGAGLLLSAVALVASGTLTLADDGHGNGNNNNGEVRLRTNLAGGAIAGQKPEGNADFRMEASRSRARLNVEVEHVNLPQGTVLQVSISHAGVATNIGTITLNAFGGGELELNSQDGATVPSIAAGDMVMVLNGTAVILSGAFGS